MIKVEQINELVSNGFKVLLIDDMVISVSKAVLYSPSDHIYYNKFVGKIIPDNYIEGNFNKLYLVIDKLHECTLIIPKDANYKYFT